MQTENFGVGKEQPCILRKSEKMRRKNGGSMNLKGKLSIKEQMDEETMKIKKRKKP